MNLLILTQKVDKEDDNLGFFHEWIKKFAEKTDKVFVVANFVGEHSLLANVQIFSLGKEGRRGRLSRYATFYKQIFVLMPQADAVFVHMIPVWVILVWPIALIYGKKIYLWYTHKSVTLPLRIAEKLVERIFTASPESCRIKSKKVVVTGHGIDTEHFKPQEFTKNSGALRFLAVGRITPAKDYGFLLDVLLQLKKQSGNDNFILDVVGSPVTKEDFFYKKQLEKTIAEKHLKNINFLGAKTYAEMPDVYNGHDVLLHASETGSLDKAVLEAMSCGLPVLTTSEAFSGMIEVLPKDANIMAEKIACLPNLNRDMSSRNIIITEHGLDNLIKKIIKLIEN